MTSFVACGCGAVYSTYNVYCQKCNSVHWTDNFKNWTSGVDELDELIQESQLSATADYELIEWIDPLDLEKSKCIGAGLYQGIWKSGPLLNSYENKPGDFLTIHYVPFWNKEQSKWNRSCDHEVAIKTFNNFDLFLKEVSNNLKFNCEVVGAELINRIYGVTKLDDTNEFAIVTRLYRLGDLRGVLRNDIELSFLQVVGILSKISSALQTIHAKGYVHNDMHCGNILIKKNSIGYFEAVISTFGRSVECRNIHWTNDIYGFGSIMYEIISGIDSPPDSRPPIPEYAPQHYVALMTQCLDVDRTKRPTANQLAETLHGWFSTLIGDNKPTQPNGLSGFLSRWFSDVINKINKIKEDWEIRKAFTKDREQQWQKQMKQCQEKSILYGYI